MVVTNEDDDMIMRRALTNTKALIDEAIVEKLDIQNLSSSTSNTFRIADLGCSVGPNTFISMQNIIEVVEELFHSKGLEFKTPEFQVFFNDHASNDFNTLFTSLPPEIQYFATGVPGSFYGRLFPKSSLNIVYSAFALQWLSRVPEKILDKDSSAWNKGNIFYTTASDEVANAYAAQFAEDTDKFLNYRATEVVSGGLMLLLTPTAPDEFHRSEMFGGWIYDALGSSLMDLAKEGLINESQVDSFNMPLYIVRPKEMVKLVEMNACFSIEKIEMTTPLLRIDEPINMDTCTTHVRAGNEKLIAEYFGNEIMDELFDRFYQKVAKLSMVDSKYKENTLLFIALKRK
ncbi:hypothetical protein ACSBR2_039512 [Camellia fascicularis]